MRWQQRSAIGKFDYHLPTKYDTTQSYMHVRQNIIWLEGDNGVIRTRDGHQAAPWQKQRLRQRQTSKHIRRLDIYRVLVGH